MVLLLAFEAELFLNGLDQTFAEIFVVHREDRDSALIAEP
jgi:hypothetical protein